MVGGGSGLTTRKKETRFRVKTLLLASFFSAKKKTSATRGKRPWQEYLDEERNTLRPASVGEWLAERVWEPAASHRPATANALNACRMKSISFPRVSIGRKALAHYIARSTSGRTGGFYPGRRLCDISFLSQVEDVIRYMSDAASRHTAAWPAMAR